MTYYRLSECVIVYFFNVCHSFCLTFSRPVVPSATSSGKKMNMLRSFPWYGISRTCSGGHFKRDHCDFFLSDQKSSFLAVHNWWDLAVDLRNEGEREFALLHHHLHLLLVILRGRNKNTLTSENKVRSPFEVLHVVRFKVLRWWVSGVQNKEQTVNFERQPGRCHFTERSYLVDLELSITSVVLLKYLLPGAFEVNCIDQYQLGCAIQHTFSQQILYFS